MSRAACVKTALCSIPNNTDEDVPSEHNVRHAVQVVAQYLSIETHRDLWPHLTATRDRPMTLADRQAIWEILNDAMHLDEDE